MNPIDELIPILKKLRLSGVLNSLELRTNQASEDNLSHIEFLYRLLCDEVERRDGKLLQMRLRRAAFEHEKTIEEFEFHFNPEVPKGKILDLATCGFVAKRECVALIGPTGVGKSHIAQAIGHRACMAGHTVLYSGTREMLTFLRSARADDSYERKLQRYIGPDVLILDDLGLQPLRLDEPLDLYEVLRRRYEHSSTIITSNRAVEEWYPLFRDDLLASAALDRFLHHAHVIEMNGDSYRNPPKKSTA